MLLKLFIFYLKHFLIEDKKTPGIFFLIIKIKTNCRGILQEDGWI